jgi:hypothetical protein
MQESQPSEYVINNVQQLFPLNQNLANFRATFVVQSLSGEPFMGLVVNQQALDSGEAITFRTSEQGTFSGEIVQDNNENMNWYLALKSTKPNKVTIDIRTQAVAPKPVQPLAMTRAQAASGGSSAASSKSWWNNWTQLDLSTKVLIGLVLFAIAFYVYKTYYVRRDAGAEEEMNLSPFIPPGELLPPLTPKTASAFAAPNLFAAAPVAAAPVAAAPVAATDAAAAANVAGMTTATVLGEDLLAKVKGLPDI